jgi:hypothetical protein
LSDPAVPKIFKLSSCEKAFGCIDFNTALAKAGQYFVKVFQMLTETSFGCIDFETALVKAAQHFVKVFQMLTETSC